MASDNFDGLDQSPIQAPWVSGPGAFVDMNRLNNAIEGQAAGGDCGAYYAGAASSGNQYCQATIVNGGSTGDYALLLRCSTGVVTAPCDCYFIYVSTSSGNIQIYSNDDTGSLNLVVVGAAFTQVFAANDVLRAEVSGTTISVFRNGGLLGTRSTSGEWSTGQPGLYTFNADAIFDNWSGGDMVSITWDQQGYWWRRDDGTEVNTAGGATYIGSQNDPL